MVAEAELKSALEAGSKYQPAIRSARYNAEKDEVTLGTLWGNLTFQRSELPYFKDVPRQMMAGLYVSHTGLHIDEMDLDVSSAGLLEELFGQMKEHLAAYH